MSKPPVSTNSIFRACADETRLRLLKLLQHRELCVCELCQVLGLAQPKASRHLAYLRRVGFVTVRQVGKWKYYSLTKEPTGLRRKLLDCVRTCLGEVAIFRDDLKRLRRVTAGACTPSPPSRTGSRRCC